MARNLFPTAVALSLALHAALLMPGCDPPTPPDEPVSPRDLRFFLAQIMPAGDDAEPATAPAPDGDLEALPEGAEQGGDPGPELFRYVHDVVAPRVYARLRARRADAVAVVQIEITRYGDLAAVRVIEPAADDRLNVAAVDAVFSAAPFPPPDIDRASILINCRFDFSLLDAAPSNR